MLYLSLVLSLAEASKASEHPLELGGFKSSVVGLTPELTMTFVARNQANLR